MNIILLSGGSGKRLWPLSNEVRSKQFLKVVKNENNEITSMLQRVYGQLCEAGIGKEIVIATSAVQENSIKNQLGKKVSVVIEPERRNTYPAILLASAYLYLVKKCPLDSIVAVLPVDPYVTIHYYKKVRELEEVLQNNLAQIALLGVVPTYPSEKYGYIIPGNCKGNYYKVEEFKEKPSQKDAEEYIKQGGFWNCGVFGFKLKYIMDILRDELEFNCYEDIVSQYQKLKNISFDYEIVEKEHSEIVLPYQGEWKDLGTWNTLTEVMESTKLGNVRLADDCLNTHVINELDIPIVVLGANNMVVAASPDGILVADKEKSSYIKNQVENIHQRPMFEEREWGDYKVLDITVNKDGINSLTKRKKIKGGAEIEYQLHKNRAEIWTVLNGSCIITIEDQIHEAKTGDTFSIGNGVKHGLKAISEVELLEVQIGKELIEDGTEIVCTDN